MAQARRGYDGDFTLVTEGHAEGRTGKNVTLPCHLSPETSAVSMTIRWFKEKECIYLYKNGQIREVIERVYEDRLTLDTQELKKGNVSLTLKDCRETDRGVYNCQVTHGEQEVGAVVILSTCERQQDMEQQQKLIQYQQDLRTQVQKLTVQLKEKESELEQIKIEKDKSLEERDQQLKEIHKLKTEIEKLLNQKDEELRTRRTKLDNVTTENTQLGASTTQQNLTMVQEKDKCLKTVRPEFIERVSEPILHSLLDRLLSKNVINDAEMDSIIGEKLRADKARGIIDMVRKKGNKASSEMIHILNQLDPNLSEHLHYWHSIYLEKEAQVGVKLQRDREEMMKLKEEEMRERFEKELKESLREKEETIKELQGQFSEIECQLTELKKQMSEERDKEKKRELEQKLKRERERRKDIKRKLEKCKEKSENEKREMEERHKQEIEEMREKYEGQARVEAERYLMKIILPEIASSIMISKTKMQREFERQLVCSDMEKNREVTTLREELEEINKRCSVLEEENLNLSKKREDISVESVGERTRDGGERRGVSWWRRCFCWFTEQ